MGFPSLNSQFICGAHLPQHRRALRLSFTQNAIVQRLHPWIVMVLRVRKLPGPWVFLLWKRAWSYAGPRQLVITSVILSRPMEIACDTTRALQEGFTEMALKELQVDLLARGSPCTHFGPTASALARIPSIMLAISRKGTVESPLCIHKLRQVGTHTRAWPLGLWTFGA